MAQPKILVVDDAVENVRILKALLQEIGHVVFSLDGAGALKQAEQHRPDIILLDVVMPVMDGYETCRQLKANPATSDIPVIFVTGADSKGDRERGLAAGATDYIYKPFEPEIVRALVRRHALALRTA